MAEQSPIFGLLVEFDKPRELINAAHTVRKEGYRQIDAYTPYPIHELTDALGHRHTRLPLLVFLGGLSGCLGGFFLQYYASAVDYPLNVGGRPFNSWPMWIPVMFELTVLLSALTAVVGMIALNGLPMPYHPLFNIDRFSLASQDKYFLCIEASDPKFDLQATRQFLESLHPTHCWDVPR